MASRLTLFLKSTVAKMAMTLEQTRQAIIDRMQSFTGIAQERIQYPNAPDFTVPTKGVWCRLTIAGGRVLPQALQISHVHAVPVIS
ncbi:hypothetical protein BANRA_04033 [Acinetobacter baumannii]|nr:hypothetical protein BANRA_04033 [Acinetobacter baumannii]